MLENIWTVKRCRKQEDEDVRKLRHKLTYHLMIRAWFRDALLTYRISVRFDRSHRSSIAPNDRRAWHLWEYHTGKGIDTWRIYSVIKIKVSNVKSIKLGTPDNIDT